MGKSSFSASRAGQRPLSIVLWGGHDSNQKCRIVGLPQHSSPRGRGPLLLEKFEKSMLPFWVRQHFGVALWDFEVVFDPHRCWSQCRRIRSLVHLGKPKEISKATKGLV